MSWAEFRFSRLFANMREICKEGSQAKPCAKSVNTHMKRRCMWDAYMDLAIPVEPRLGLSDRRWNPRTVGHSVDQCNTVRRCSAFLEAYLLVLRYREPSAPKLRAQSSFANDPSPSMKSMFWILVI